MYRRRAGHSDYSGGYLVDINKSNIHKVAVIGAGVMGAVSPPYCQRRHSRLFAGYCP